MKTMKSKPELREGDAALDRFSKALKAIFSVSRKDAERIRMARASDLSAPDTATASQPVWSKYSNAQRVSSLHIPKAA